MTMTVADPTCTYEPGHLYEVDPGQLMIGANVRTDTRPDAKAFAASIKARGVIEAITAYLDEAGGLTVLRGQRRTVVAVQVGTPSGTVPVRVVQAPGEVDRITDQMVENLHRADMHVRETRDGVEQLALLGVSAAQITKRLSVPRETVDAALVVVKHAATRARMDEAGMTLDEAALFAEFEDEPRDIDRLTAAWNDPWTRKRLAHVAQEVRDERAERAAVLKEIERLRGEGLPVFDPDTIPSDEVWRLRLDELRDEDDQPVPPERWASILGAGVLVEAEWDGEDRPVFTPTWVCLDPEAAGLHRGYRITPTPDARTAPTGEESDEDRAEREAADLARREAESAERRQVLANNKAWRAAQTVRRQWLTGLLARRVVPKGAEVLIARALVGRAFALTYAMEHGHTLLATVLGITGPDTRPGGRVADRVLEQATTAKAATMRTLGAVLAAWEDRSDVHTWRRPGTFDGEVMAALIGWGYPATDVERLLVPTTDTVDPGEQDQPDPADTDPDDEHDEHEVDGTDPDEDLVGSDEDDLPVGD